MRITTVDTQALSRLSLSRGQWTLLWLIADHVNVETGVARISTTELGKRMKWQSANVSRELTRFVRRGILTRIMPGVLVLNPRLMSRLSLDDWEDALAQAPEIDWKGEG